MRPRLLIVIGLMAVLASGCAASPTTPSAAPTASPAPVSPSASAAASGSPWADSLAFVDEQVRARHPSPFAINPESAWVAKLAELETTLPDATQDEQLVQLAGLTGLLDTHSGVYGPTHVYPFYAYAFPEGWFVVAARDETLVGSRLVSIGGTLVKQVESALRPLVPADNESGELIGVEDQLSTVEVLHGLGFVDDTSKPGFAFEKPDGSQMTVDLEPEVIDSEWIRSLNGYLMGDAPKAVARRGEPVWTRLDKPTKTFVLSYNDYTEYDLEPALAAMKAALDDGSAERVVVDMRYILGGNGSLAFPLIEALKSDERINRPGGLTALIGRENVSAGTIVAGAIDRETEAVLIGEPTPARADNFLCDCVEIPIGETEFVVSIPTQFLANGDTRDAVLPDIPFELTAADFFAGKDPALDLALSGAQP